MLCSKLGIITTYYDRGATYNRDMGPVVLTADQVLYDGDVVSRSDGFGTTATRTPVSRTMTSFFWKSGSLTDPGPLWTSPSVGITSSDAVSSKTFQVAMFL